MDGWMDGWMDGHRPGHRHRLPGGPAVRIEPVNLWQRFAGTIGSAVRHQSTGSKARAAVRRSTGPQVLEDKREGILRFGLNL
eukprot:9343642-Karenia_brevis.AAC.1